MFLRINELKLRPDHTRKDLEQEILKTLRLRQTGIRMRTDEKHASKNEVLYDIMRRSIDARKKPDLFFSYTIDVLLKDPKSVLQKCKSKKVSLAERIEYRFPVRTTEHTNHQEQTVSPVIIGSGPAGLFCALMLARAGVKPILLERGESVEERMKSVEEFWKTGVLNPQSNVQFGEGGAGTFSDGKLNTLIKDPNGRIRFVLKEFINAGAKEEILYDHKPHIGTDVLVHVVKHIRQEILRLGGEIRFQSCLTGIRVLPSSESGCRLALEINGEESALQTDHLVLAIGHSARDTIQMLYDMNLPMQAKAFAVGLRMEHPQDVIDEAMYGAECPYELGAAPYKVTHKCENGRGVYSFCMCPGGFVVNASSEEGRTAVNGMSYSGRDSANANSAIVVTVSPEDYGDNHPLSGIEFQRKLEEAAWKCGQGRIPVQRLEDFRENRKTETFGRIQPVMKGLVSPANVREILPEDINTCLLEGVDAFGRRIRGFDHPDALVSGVESRTSSPVRMIRDENCCSSVPGIYPCGEGAGYAGGITSAAVDGIRVAEAVYNSLKLC